MLDRILYFGYVLFTTIKHRKKLHEYSKFFKTKYDKSAVWFLYQAFYHYLRYEIHPLDYFYYNLHTNKNFNPDEHANTLFMHRFHKRLNCNKFNKYFKNKIKFNLHFKDYIKRDFVSLKKVDIEEFKYWILNRKPSSLILKKLNSVGGFGVRKIKVEVNNQQILLNNISYYKSFKLLRKFDLAEEFVQQHELLNRLNPSCLNTVRIVTVLDKNNSVNIIGAVLRLGVNSDVDNFHSGGIAINVNVKTGCLTGYGFKLAPGEPEFYKYHPETKIKLDGYQLPHWDQVLEVVKKACFVFPDVHTVGWDIGITQDGVCLIEGNHDWDKIIIEKALKRGIKKELEKYL